MTVSQMGDFFKLHKGQSLTLSKMLSRDTYKCTNRDVNRLEKDMLDLSHMPQKIYCQCIYYEQM